MIIEYTNTIPPKTHSTISVAIVLATCAFFFIPTTLIILGYLSSRPTGNLISPLPQGVLSQQPTSTPIQPLPQTDQPVTETPVAQEVSNAPIIAAPGDETSTPETNIVPESSNNIIDKTASVSAGLAEITVSDQDIKTTSQIYLSPRSTDKTIYSVKSKQDGQMIIQVNTPSDTVRYIDYHIVNP